MGELTHFDDHGATRMVDVSSKPVSERFARASGRVHMAATTLELILDRGLSKGDVIEVARLAGIMAAKRTGDLIPLCHPLGIDAVDVRIAPAGDSTLEIEASVRVVGRTGVEMEALVAVSITALTIYDMCKSVDKNMTIDCVRLEEKRGGRTGVYLRRETADPETDRA